MRNALEINDRIRCACSKRNSECLKILPVVVVNAIGFFYIKESKKKSTFTNVSHWDRGAYEKKKYLLFIIMNAF